MARAWLRIAAVILLPVAVCAQSKGNTGDLPAILARLAASVERYYERAQSLVCLETIRLQTLNPNMTSDGSFARILSYELRVSWDAADDGQSPTATVQRELMRVNNRTPGPKDKPKCFDPEAATPDSLAMFLTSNQREYTFTLAGTSKVNGRLAQLVDARKRETGPIKVTPKEGVDEGCWSVDTPGRERWRVWMDAESGDILRLDERLMNAVDIRYDDTKNTKKRWMQPLDATLDHYESTITFKPVTFTDPDETLTLPISQDSLQLGRGFSSLRTTQTYTNYRRFLTGGRVVQE